MSLKVCIPIGKYFIFHLFKYIIDILTLF